MNCWPKVNVLADDINKVATVSPLFAAVADLSRSQSNL